MRRQSPLVLIVLLAIAYLDQISKAWAWRHLVDVHVNSGGDILLGGSGLGDWFRDPIAGAMFDAGNAMLLLGAGWLFLRKRRPVTVLLSGTMLLAGWSSNLLDRLGLHHMTAPGSVRGVVDFIPWDGRYWNVADLAIIVGSVGLALSLAGVGLRAAAGRRPSAHAQSQPRVLSRAEVRSRPLGRTRVRVAAAGGVLSTCVLTVIGAVGYAGVSQPVAAMAARR